MSGMTDPEGTNRTQDALAAEFERHRDHLRSVAYRMLGSVTDAEDAVQETWLRLARRDPGGSGDLRGWLTVVVGRICLDMLRARKSRREELAGSWLPEPIVQGADPSTPERDALLADSIGLALLVVLESLSPPERVSFVLHDVFGVPFDDIARIVDRSPAAARQLASRARRRVRSEAPDPNADLAVQRRVVDAFLAAARNGDFEVLMRLLDKDVVVRIDAGQDAPPSLPRVPLTGAEAVAFATKGLQGGAGSIEPIIVNGAAGVLVRFPARSMVAAFTIVDERIVAIDVVADPAKLRGLSDAIG